jgi:hypothetical protein
MSIRFGLKTGCDNTQIRRVLAHGAIPNLGADLAPLRVPLSAACTNFGFSNMFAVPHGGSPYLRAQRDRKQTVPTMNDCRYKGRGDGPGLPPGRR